MPTVSITNTDSNLSAKTLQILERDQTVTGLHTYNRGASAPFAVVSGAAVVTNLDADKVDGIEGTAFLLKAGGTMTGALLFTDATYDIGASGATRPRDIFLSRDLTVGRYAILADDIKLAATKKVYLDGGTNTYIVESAADTVDIYTNAARALTIDSTQFIDSPTQPRCSVYNSGAQSHNSTGNVLALTFDTEHHDTGAMHSTVSNTSRLTVPTGGDGLYLITFATSFAANVTGQRQLSIYKNGTSVTGGPAYKAAGLSASFEQTGAVSAVLVLVAGDYVEGMAFQDSGGNLNLTSNYAAAVKLW